MKLPVTFILLFLIIPATTQAQNQTEMDHDLELIYTDLVLLTDSLEDDVRESGLTFPEIMFRIDSIRSRLYLAKELLDNGQSTDARSILVQTAASLSILRDDVQDLKENKVNSDDPILAILIIALIVIIAILYVTLMRIKKSYKPWWQK
jgi:hypothetical protein